MKKGVFLVYLILFFLLIFTSKNTLAQGDHITLLAVSEIEGGGLIGSTADLSLEILPGSGRVFIDSYPLTKIDTQVTTRFAKEIACSYIDADCSQYDFFYTMRASSAIVGGASAGAATTILTISALQGHTLPKDIAITGTINSGNLIGPVSGLKEKIEAAGLQKIKTVLIPKPQAMYRLDDNATKSTLNLTAFGKEQNIKVLEVASLEESLPYFNEQIVEPKKNFTINKQYLEKMSILANKLCNRSNAILTSTLRSNYENGIPMQNRSLSLEESAIDFIRKAQVAKEKGSQYAQASFCYGANTKYREIELIQKNISIPELKNAIKIGFEEMHAFDIKTDQRKIATITDLEAYMIVKERIVDTIQNLNDAEKHIEKDINSRENFQNSDNDKNISEARFFLANAYERFYSAQSWSSFFTSDGEAIQINDAAIKDSCSSKIEEAEERYQYITLLFPKLDYIRKEINDAEHAYQTKKYSLCLFQASKAKADANVILSSLSSSEKDIDFLISEKLSAAQNSVARETAKGIFPILGYSYYEYANSLKNESKSAALTYAEYAIELSNLDMYFPVHASKEKQKSILQVDQKLPFERIAVFIFLAGLVFGMLLYDFIYAMRNKKIKEMKETKKIIKNNKK